DQAKDIRVAAKALRFGSLQEESALHGTAGERGRGFEVLAGIDEVTGAARELAEGAFVEGVFREPLFLVDGGDGGEACAGAGAFGDGNGTAERDDRRRTRFEQAIVKSSAASARVEGAPVRGWADSRVTSRSASRHKSSRTADALEAP